MVTVQDQICCFQKDALYNVSGFPPQPSLDCGGRCSRSWKRLVKPSRMIFWMLACQFTEHWGATSASVLTMLPKWVHETHLVHFSYAYVCATFVFCLPLSQRRPVARPTSVSSRWPSSDTLQGSSCSPHGSPRWLD